MTINPTVDLGNIITLLGMLIVLITFGASLKSSVDHLDKRIAKVEHKLDEQNEILISLARFEGRLAVLEQQSAFALDVRRSEFNRLSEREHKKSTAGER